MKTVGEKAFGGNLGFGVHGAHVTGKCSYHAEPISPLVRLAVFWLGSPLHGQFPGDK